ncbi:MAG: chorismate synthase [Coriobacteriia bacterium]|nr:chorismate synthase [Coriobacteriia bacterium]
MRYSIAGESHGPKITVIIEDVPAGIPLTEKAINYELKRRSAGIGRSERQDAESNKCFISAGVINEKTIGSPVCIEINNDVRDYDEDEDKFPRPGHADLNGVIKYNFDDCHNVAEMFSARKTAGICAAGVIAKEMLGMLGCEVYSYVTSIGSVSTNFKDLPSMTDIAMSELMCPDAGATKKMIAQIERAKDAGDTLGGSFKLIGVGTVPGIGNKINSKFMGAISSIPTIRGVMLGDAEYMSQNVGSSVVDNIESDLTRSTNYSGGIEGGMTNGMPIVIGCLSRPIPTIKKNVATINLDTYELEKHQSSRRSDVCVVPNVAVIAESQAAIVLANEYMNKFGRDSVSEIVYALDAYKQRIKSFK